jgi:hypothetical protein
VSLRNDGPEVAEACDHCGHAWTEHHLECGCLHGWKYNKEGIAERGACYCQLAHIGVVSA